MDIDESEQLYATLIEEQEMNPSQIIPVLCGYYQMSGEEAWLVSKRYHAIQATKGVNGHTRKQLIKSYNGNRKSTEDHKRPYMLASLRGGNNRTS
mgnify:CR=1 FL=1